MRTEEKSFPKNGVLLLSLLSLLLIFMFRQAYENSFAISLIFTPSSHNSMASTSTTACDFVVRTQFLLLPYFYEIVLIFVFVFQPEKNDIIYENGVKCSILYNLTYEIVMIRMI